jgi:hypothetical protein
LCGGWGVLCVWLCVVGVVYCVVWWVLCIVLCGRCVVGVLCMGFVECVEGACILSFFTHLTSHTNTHAHARAHTYTQHTFLHA